MKGTPINKAAIKPILIAGVEKRLALLNALLSFPLIAASHFKLPAAFIGIIFYILMHFIFVMISKHDPLMGNIFKRSTRYSRSYFPAKSHPLTIARKVKTISRPFL